MANTVNGLLTTYGSVVQVQLNYLKQSSSFFFIGKVDAWPDDLNPESPSQTQSYIKKAFKNVFATKALSSANFSPVVPRIDWIKGNVYVPYSDYTDVLAVDSNGVIISQFYVRNNYDQIFKCLSNNKGVPSTVQPLLQAGTTDVTQTLYLADGYKWIYVTTIDKGLKKDFFDNNWMPISFGSSTPNPLLPAKMGSINAINVTNSGNNYSNGYSTTTVTIGGDGTGATAQANVFNNIVQDVLVTNTGNNYTYATVTITPVSGLSGSSATANVIVSPVGGHASDPVSELGCNHVMISAEFDESESGNVPTNISYRQLGIITNPILKTGIAPTSTLYNTSDLATVSYGLGTFTSGETVFQGSTLSSATFKATCCSFDTSNNIISLINTQGTYTLGSSLTGNSSGISRVLLTYSPTSWSVGSGYMSYLENRIPVQRSANGNEQFRLVLRF